MPSTIGDMCSHIHFYITMYRYFVFWRSDWTFTYFLCMRLPLKAALNWHFTDICRQLLTFQFLLCVHVKMYDKSTNRPTAHFIHSESFQMCSILNINWHSFVSRHLPGISETKTILFYVHCTPSCQKIKKSSCPCIRTCTYIPYKLLLLFDGKWQTTALHIKLIADIEYFLCVFHECQLLGFMPDILTIYTEYTHFYKRIPCALCLEMHFLYWTH